MQALLLDSISKRVSALRCRGPIPMITNLAYLSNTDAETAFELLDQQDSFSSSEISYQSLCNRKCITEPVCRLMISTDSQKCVTLTDGPRKAPHVDHASKARAGHRDEIDSQGPEGDDHQRVDPLMNAADDQASDRRREVIYESQECDWDIGVNSSINSSACASPASSRSLGSTAVADLIAQGYVMPSGVQYYANSPSAIFCTVDEPGYLEDFPMHEPPHTPGIEQVFKFGGQSNQQNRTGKVARTLFPENDCQRDRHNRSAFRNAMLTDTSEALQQAFDADMRPSRKYFGKDTEKLYSDQEVYNSLATIGTFVDPSTPQPLKSSTKGETSPSLACPSTKGSPASDTSSFDDFIIGGRLTTPPPKEAYSDDSLYHSPTQASDQTVTPKPVKSDQGSERIADSAEQLSKTLKGIGACLPNFRTTRMSTTTSASTHLRTNESTGSLPIFCTPIDFKAWDEKSTSKPKRRSAKAIMLLKRILVCGTNWTIEVE